MSIPVEFICPISKKLMSDPVVALDGYTYDRTSIIKANYIVSPYTAEVLSKKNLLPNKVLKDTITNYYKKEKENKLMSDPSSYEREKLIQFWESSARTKDEDIVKRINRETQSYLKSEKSIIEKQQITLSKQQIFVRLFDQRWCTSLLSKFKFSDSVDFFISLDINNMFIYYKILLDDYVWIKKFVYGSDGSIPLVDYIFDNYIKGFKNKEMIPADLQIINQTREYYYQNSEPFIKTYSKSVYMDELNKLRRVKLKTFINAKTFLKLDYDPLEEFRNLSDNNQKNEEGLYIKDCNSKYFNELVKLAKIYIDVIETIFPEISLKYHE